MSTIKTNRIEPVGSTAGTVTVDAVTTFMGGSASISGNATVGPGNYFMARYGDGAIGLSYSSKLAWNYLQLGNNGLNWIVAGEGQTNGSLYFVVNNRTQVRQSTGSDIAHDGITAMTITKEGNVGIGTITPGASLSVAGNVSVSGTAVMASPFMYRNRVINGSMIVNQRGTTTNPNINGFGPTTGPVSISSATTSRPYDRWQFQRSPGITFQFYGGLTVSPPQGFTRYCRILSGATAGGVAGGSYANTSVSSFFQPIEASTLMDFDYGKSTAKTSTVSFWVRSNQTGTFEGQIGSYPTGTRSYLFPYTINSADTWEYKTVTIPGDTTSGGWTYDFAPTTLVDNTASRGFAYLGFNLGSGLSGYGTRNTWLTRDGVYLGYSPYTDGTGVQITGYSGGYLDITGVQWELGNVATPFEHRPYETELALCQRYFQRNIYQNFAGYGVGGAGIVQTLTLLRPMRAIPTMTRYNPAAFSFSNCSASSGTGVHGEAYSNHNYILHVTVTTTGSFQFNNSAAAGFDYSAEL